MRDLNFFSRYSASVGVGSANVKYRVKQLKHGVNQLIKQSFCWNMETQKRFMEEQDPRT